MNLKMNLKKINIGLAIIIVNFKNEELTCNYVLTELSKIKNQHFVVVVNTPTVIHSK